MADDGSKHAGIEETLFQLLQAGGGRDMDQGNLLILLSLVNLMGIINIINHRMGVRTALDSDPAGGSRESSRALPFDPAHLLSMLGGKDGSGVNPGQLAGLLSRIMATPGGQTQGPAPGEPAGEINHGQSRDGGKTG